MKVIGLVGPKGSGKDTVAAMLKDAKRSHGKISFAGPLKEMISKVFEIPIQVLNDPILKEKAFATPIVLTPRNLRAIKHECMERLDRFSEDGSEVLYFPDKASITGLEGREMRSPRELMQIIGTDFIRTRIYTEYHTRAAFTEKALSKLVKSGVYCVTDIRFVNEYEFLAEKFGADFVCFYVERPEAEENLKSATHPSELESQTIKKMLPAENVIMNGGTMEELEAKLSKLKLPEGTEKTPAKKGSRFVYKQVGKSGK